MKPLLILIFMISVNLLATGQLTMKETPELVKVGGFKAGSYTVATLSYHIQEGDTTFYLLFLNQEYEYLKDYESISFSGSETLEQLYQVMNSIFSKENEKTKMQLSFTLGSDNVILSSWRALGATAGTFWTQKGKFNYNQAQLKKLFGR